MKKAEKKYYIVRLNAMNGRGINGVGSVEFITTDEIDLNQNILKINVLCDSSALFADEANDLWYSFNKKGTYIIPAANILYIKEIPEERKGFLERALNCQAKLLERRYNNIAKDDLGIYETLDRWCR